MNPNTNITSADLAYGISLLGRASVDGRQWVAFFDGAYRHVVEQCHWDRATATLPGEDMAAAYNEWCSSHPECWADDATAEMVARRCNMHYVHSAVDGCCGRIDINLDEECDDAPRLTDYLTGEDLRDATDEEIAASRDAGPEGVILLADDGTILRADDAGADEARRVYVAE